MEDRVAGLDEILDAPAVIFGALIGLRWRRREQARRAAKRAQDKRDIEQGHLWAQAMARVNGSR